MGNWKTVPVAVLTVMIILFQSYNTIADEDKRFSISGQSGAVTLDGVPYYQLSLMPKINAGKFSAIFDVDILWNDKDGFKKWKSEDWTDVIYKLTWGEKGTPPAYVSLGSMESATLGNGTLINNYRNSTKYSLQRGFRRAGLEFDLSFSKWGIETISNDIFDFNLGGARFYVEPFNIFKVNVPVLQNLQIGYTYAVDVDAADTDSVDTISVDNYSLYGNCLDITVPVIEKKLIAYADYAQIKSEDVSYGNGLIIGVRGSLNGEWLDFSYKLDSRRVDKDFIAGIFDNNYETYKPVINTLNIIKNDTNPNSTTGYFGLASFMFARAVTVSFSYEDYNNSSLESQYPRFISELNVDKKVLQLISRLKIGVNAVYDIINAESIFNPKPKTAHLTANIDYYIADNVLWRYTYLRTFDSSGEDVKTSSMGIQFNF